MNSDKFDSLLFALHSLQNADFHLIAVPGDKINRKEEKEMEQTFRLKEQSFTFDKKGMILKGRVSNDGHRIFVRAWDIYLNNKGIMSDEDVKYCFENGIDEEWVYWISELDSLSLSLLEFELLKYYIKHGYQYITRDSNGALFASDTKPYKGQKQWEQTKEIKGINFRDLFSFVKWEDDEPYPITYILDNCKVDENV